MKKNSLKLLALLLTGCIALNGCGAAASTNNSTETAANPANEQTEEQTDNTGETSTEATVTDSSLALTDNTAAQDSTAIKNSTAAADNTASLEIISGEQHSVVGIITDATKYSIAIQTPDGNHYYLTIPETGVTGNLNYITVGQMATLKYVGSLDENHASLVDISNSSIVTGIYLEEYSFAIQVINAVRSMNMEALSDLTNFPVFIDTGNYKGPMNTSGEFEAISSEKIFTEALVTRMANYNLFDLKYTDAGFVMGNGTPCITFDVDDDGILGIIGINSAPAPVNSNS